MDTGTGRLISFEGLDGAGKTTQIDLLENWLKKRGISYLRTREPGGTPLGVEIRRLLLTPGRDTAGSQDTAGSHDKSGPLDKSGSHDKSGTYWAITPLAEAFLFQADRAQHFATVVLPALEAGTLVVTDRCFDASIAYQGFARGVGVELVERLSLLATQGRVPDLTILLDLDPAQVHARTDVAHDRSGLREEQTRFDSEEESFHRRVQEGFRLLARSHPERIKVVDASRSIQEIHEEIVRLVELLLRS